MAWLGARLLTWRLSARQWHGIQRIGKFNDDYVPTGFGL